MGAFDWESQERIQRKQDERAWGIARESYAEFKASGGQADLSEHPLYRLQRMLTLAEQEEHSTVSRYADHAPRRADSFEGSEVKKSLGIETDHAWVIADRIRSELKRRLEQEQKRQEKSNG